MGRKRNSREDLSGGNELHEESSGDTDADDAFLIMDSEGEDDIPNTQPADDRVLKDVIAYVEVRTKTENRSKGVSKQLELLGAKVEKKFTNDVTHVVWKDGKKSTRDRAVKKGIKLVSVLWVDSCKQNQEHVAASLFPVSAPDEKDVIQIGKLKRMKSMQPKEVEEDIQRSAGRGTRKRRARILHSSPAPLTAINPAILVAETQPMSSPVTREIPHTPSLIPDTPSSMKPCLDLLDSIKKGQGSAHRRLSITNSPNISPSTPLRQRLLHCFTEEANSCTESPSTSVKLQKSGPVRRPNSRRKLTEEDVEMEIDSPSVETEVKSRGRGRRSTATNGGVKLAEEGEVKLGVTAEVATRNTPSGTKLEAVKVGSPPAEEAGSRRSRGSRSTATPRGTKLTEEGKGEIGKPVGEVAASSRGRGRSSATPRGRTSDVGGASSHQGEVDKPTVMENNSSSAGDNKEQDSKKKGKGRRDISLKRKLSLDSEGSSSQDRTSVGSKMDCKNVNDGSVGLERKRCSRSKASNKTISTVAERSDVSEINDVYIVSTGICGTDDGTRSSSQEKKSSRLQEDCKSSKNGSASAKRKRLTSSKDSDELLSAEKCGDSETSNVAIASTRTCGTGSTRSSTRRRSCVPALPVQPSTEDGQMDQIRRRSNRRKSVTPVFNAPSLADHLKPSGVQSTSLNSVPGKMSSVGRTKGAAKGPSPSDVALKEEEECHHPKKKQKSRSTGSFQKSRSPGGSQKSTFEGVKEKPAKFEEKENQKGENVLPEALGQRIGSMNADDGRKRKLLSPLPSDLACSSILSSIEVQNRPSIEEFKLEGSLRHTCRAKRPTLKDSVDTQLCTSSEESVVSSEDLDDTRKETKGGSTASKEKKKKKKKVTLSDSMPTSRKKKSTIVMTSLHRSDQEIVISVVKDLGSFEVTDTVCDTTTHVVVGENRRTLNVLSGIARGSWIVSMDWVYRSIEAGSWLPEEPYEMNVHFPGAMISRLAHGAESDNETSPVDIFSSCDALYIPPESNPPRERLLELVELCGGHISRKVSDAKLCVGGSGRGKKGSTPVVAERWILDCITRFKLVPWDSYKVNKF